MSYKQSEAEAIMTVASKTRVTITGLPSEVVDPDDYPVIYNAKLEYFDPPSWLPLEAKNLLQYDDTVELASSPEVTDVNGDVTLTIATTELSNGVHTIRVKYLGD